MIDRTVDALVDAERDPLPGLIVGARGRDQVDGQVGQRGMGDRLGAGDHAAQADVRGEVPVRALELLEREVQLRLVDPLPKVEVESIRHARPSPPRG